MASNSYQRRSLKQKLNIQFNYQEIKRGYLKRLNMHDELIKPLCTKEGIEEKIQKLIENPNEAENFVVDTKGWKTKLYRKNKKGLMVEVLPAKEAFDIILNAHIECNHGLVSTTYEKLTQQYSLPIFCVSWLVESCNVCCPNVLNVLTGEESDIPPGEESNIVTIKEPRGVWRMNVIRDNSLVRNPRSRVCYLLILKEVSTNFVILRPLFESSNELALELTKLFTEFGYPEQVFVPNMIEFYRCIFRLVYLINPVTDVPVDPWLNHDLFDKDKMEVLKELGDWMKMMDDIYWDLSCSIVQYKLNTTERDFTRMDTNEESSGIPFNLFFNFEARTKMTWIDPQVNVKPKNI